ncbi:MAG: ribosomal protein S18 acetylase RimI-like enzyme [Enterobacterales bacterium]|jgi:ribosomal protein S18 acetylase RimI-like enzyme
MHDDYRVTTNQSEMDVEAIHQYLTNSYWSPGLPLETLRKALQNSFCFAALKGNEQIGFARLITDYTTFAYLADVYILEAHQGKGLSKMLLDEIFKHPKLDGLRRIMLATRDAHGLYEKFGFSKLSNPDIFMENWKPDVYT